MGLARLESRCSVCVGEMPTEGTDTQEWVLVQAVDRKQKSVRCLGTPYGWTLWVDGVRVQPILQFKTIICKGCRDSMVKQTKAEISEKNTDSLAKRKRHAKVAALVALAMIPISLVCLAVYLFLDLGEIPRPLILGSIALPVIAAIVWAFIRFNDVKESADEAVEKRTNETHEKSIKDILSQVEILRGNEPTNLGQTHYVVTESVHNRGSTMGWTLFKCWGIMDEPGGTRRDEQTNDFIRWNILEQEIGEWWELQP